MAPFPTFHSDPEETAEEFVMRRMDPTDAVLYKAHLMDCNDCARKVRDAQAFAVAMHSAALDYVAKSKSSPT
jgi:hypothetical protein